MLFNVCVCVRVASEPARHTFLSGNSSYVPLSWCCCCCTWREAQSDRKHERGGVSVDQPCAEWTRGWRAGGWGWGGVRETTGREAIFHRSLLFSLWARTKREGRRTGGGRKYTARRVKAQGHNMRDSHRWGGGGSGGTQCWPVRRVKVYSQHSQCSWFSGGFKATDETLRGGQGTRESRDAWIGAWREVNDWLWRAASGGMVRYTHNPRPNTHTHTQFTKAHIDRSHWLCMHSGGPGRLFSRQSKPRSVHAHKHTHP